VQAFIPQNPNFEQMIKDKMAQNHFMNHLGFKPTLIEAAKVIGILEVKPEHKQQIGFLHGGVTATLADLAAGFAAFTLVKEGQTLVTIEMKVSYLNPGVGSHAKAIGSVIKIGQKMAFAEAEIYSINNDIETLIAKSSATYAILDI
jgi:uncharacterized protein (TIGR00369 family)